MADAGEIKAKVTIEYDGSGVEKAKEDLQSLGEITGGMGDNLSGAGDELANFGEKASRGAEGAQTFTSAIAELPKITESGTESLASMNDVLAESPKAFEDTGTAAEETASKLQKAAPAMQVVADQAQVLSEKVNTVGESFTKIADTVDWTTVGAPTDWMSSGFEMAGQNMRVFQAALEDPAPFGAIYDHLDKTGQSIEQFSNSLGESNSSLFSQMSAAQYGSDALENSFTSMGKSANEGFGAVTASAENANKAVSEFLGKPAAAAAGMEEAASSAGGLGDILSGAASDIGEAVMGVSNWVMPLMAFQMAGMAIQQIGQGIYDAAVIAEGPAAHSLGTFTGSVDALGQTAQKAAGRFSESFGRQVMPTLDAINNTLSQSGGSGDIGGFLGGTVSFLANAGMIIGGLANLTVPGGAGLGMGMIQAGGEGIVNQFAPGTFQGPPPEQQAQVNYQKAFASMPQTVSVLGSQVQTQAAQYFQMASDPQYLADQDQFMAAQQAYAHAQAVYNSRHYISPTQALMNYQEGQYDVQQNALYDQQMASQPQHESIAQALGLPDLFGSMGQSIGDFFRNSSGQQSLSGGGMRPPSSPFDGLFNNIGGFFGGIGGLINGASFSIPLPNFGDLFGGGATQPTTSGGCFPAGTLVLMADSSERAIETLQIGDRVKSHDGPTSVLALIKPPPRRVYALTFSDGSTLTLTNSHPIASTRGWKSLSPKATKKESPDLAVTTLKIGDSIHTVDGTIRELLTIKMQGVVQVHNITVDVPHTFYANGVLVHNKFAGSGVGTETVVNHTFTANVSWEAQNLEKSFTAAASWVGQGLNQGFTAIASWVGQGLSQGFTAVASWIGQGLEQGFTAVASWIGQGLEQGFTAIANWAGEGLTQSFTAIANWAGEALDHLFTGKASWVGQDLEHMFTAVAQWSAQNLNPTFTVNPSVTMLAEGTSNFAGGPALVGEGGSPEVIAHNGQYSLVNQPTLLNLPAGASVYPMRDLNTYPMPAQFADGTGDPVIPISFGGRSSGMPESINVMVYLETQALMMAMGMPFAQTIRVQSGMRSF